MKCILCGSEIQSGEVCEQCKKDYEIPEENSDKSNEMGKEGRELTEGVIAIVFSAVFPIVGFILGICFTVKNESKTLPIIAIISSLIFSVIYSLLATIVLQEII